MATAGQKPDVPREIERAGALCLAFANTAVAPPDDRRLHAASVLRLDSYPELVAWSVAMGVLEAEAAAQLMRAAAERPDDAAAAVALARRLRAALLRVFTGQLRGHEPQTDDLQAINASLRASHFVHGPDGFGWAPAVDPEALDRMLGPVARSATELLTSQALDRLRQCSAGNCHRLFIYKSARRVWCDMNTCGNRAKNQRHTARRQRARKNRNASPTQITRIMDSFRQGDQLIRETSKSPLTDGESPDPSEPTPRIDSDR